MLINNLKDKTIEQIQSDIKTQKVEIEFYSKNLNYIKNNQMNLAKDLRAKLSYFVKKNKDLYDEYFNPKDHRINGISTNKKKQAFRLSTVVNYGNGNISYRSLWIPFLLITNPKKYREFRINYLKNIENDNAIKRKESLKIELERIKIELKEII
jgi:hypothetical protein